MAEVLRNEAGKRVKKDGTEFKAPVRSELNKINALMIQGVQFVYNVDEGTADNLVAKAIANEKNTIFEAVRKYVESVRTEGK